MLICDRCGEKLAWREKEKANVVLNIYSAQGAHIGHHVDLCQQCQRLYVDYKGKMESYFLVNDDPLKVFKKERYWDEYRKFER